MKRTYITLLVAAAFMFTCTLAEAAIVVVSVKGKTAMKVGRQWKPLAKGMTLAEGTMVSTGVGSEAVLSLDGHILTVRSMTMIKIYKNTLNKKESNNNIGLRYGRINARVNRIGKLKTRFKVSTPVATSSVRGTRKELFSGAASGLKAWVPKNEAGLYTKNGGRSVIGGRSMFNMPPGSPRPDPLLDNLKWASLVKLSPDKITGDEKEGNALNAGQLIDNVEGPVDFYDQKTGNASVNINIIWP